MGPASAHSAFGLSQDLEFFVLLLTTPISWSFVNRVTTVDYSCVIEMIGVQKWRHALCGFWTDLKCSGEDDEVKEMNPVALPNSNDNKTTEEKREDELWIRQMDRKR